MGDPIKLRFIVFGRLDPAEERFVSYSSEPTGASHSTLAKFPSEPYPPRAPPGGGRHHLQPQHSAHFNPPDAPSFPDMSWVRSFAVDAFPRGNLLMA